MEIVERICTHVGIIANGELVEQTSLDELRQGNSLEQRFLERVGTTDDEKPNLRWLEETPALTRLDEASGTSRETSFNAQPQAPASSHIDEVSGASSEAEESAS